MAVAALRGYEDKKLAPIFEARYGKELDTGVIGELLRAIAPLDFPGRATQAAALLETKDSALRAEAIAVLGQKPESALIVVKLYNEGILPKQDLSRVIEAIRPHRTAELREANQELIRKDGPRRARRGRGGEAEGVRRSEGERGAGGNRSSSTTPRGIAPRATAWKGRAAPSGRT